jgi:hypothetical protein
LLRSLPKDWKCKRCLRKQTNVAPQPTSSNLPSEPASSMHAVCKESGCTNLTHPGSTLCYRHKINQRHQKAAEAAVAVKPAASSSAPPLKNIKKKKLYNFKPSEEIKHLKRKRSIEERNNIRHSEPPVRLTASSRVVTPQERPSSVGMNVPTPAETAPIQTSHQRAAQQDSLSRNGSTQSPVETGASSPFATINADLFR